MNDARAATDAYRQAAELNRSDPLLCGALLEFPDYGQLVMTGDLHGHRRNFQRLQRFCDLIASPVRHVILHELIHEEPKSLAEPDLSHEMLLEAARWKCEYPDQVHFLQSNHELSQLTGHEIIKGGRIVTRDFVCGLEQTYGRGYEDVYRAILDFITSYPWAGRTANRVFLSHSLPGDRSAAEFDAAALRAPRAHGDLDGQATAYALVWGRYQTGPQIEELARRLDADLFVCGHQPQETGYAVLHSRMLILASDHNHGVFLPIDLRRPLTMQDLLKGIRPFSAYE